MMRRYLAWCCEKMSPETPPHSQVVAPGDAGDWSQEFLRQEGGQKQDEEFWERMEREWRELAEYVRWTHACHVIVM